jgi:uncharacterized protein (DUF952 family)
MANIFRISERRAWEVAKLTGSYTGELESDGFIHMSERHQITMVANFLYTGHQDLVLLEVDTKKLSSEIRYEQLGTDQPFPHIYGVINVEAVVAVFAFPHKADGFFELPSELT